MGPLTKYVPGCVILNAKPILYPSFLIQEIQQSALKKTKQAPFDMEVDPATLSAGNRRC